MDNLLDFYELFAFSVITGTGLWGLVLVLIIIIKRNLP